MTLQTVVFWDVMLEVNADKTRHMVVSRDQNAE